MDASSWERLPDVPLCPWRAREWQPWLLEGNQRGRMILQTAACLPRSDPLLSDQVVRPDELCQMPWSRTPQGTSRRKVGRKFWWRCRNAGGGGEGKVLWGQEWWQAGQARESSKYRSCIGPASLLWIPQLLSQVLFICLSWSYLYTRLIFFSLSCIFTCTPFVGCTLCTPLKTLECVNKQHL